MTYMQRKTWLKTLKFEQLYELKKEYENKPKTDKNIKDLEAIDNAIKWKNSNFFKQLELKEKGF